ncbi:hypothetical protein [Enterococcus hulanensis]|uniref:hypothetical protein n=1 Tax=Enterococcus hulanensis TaxID=2559929 RepID=UPI001F5D9115|nr:hypothetical protein [Enterococcus hulanensis]
MSNIIISTDKEDSRWLEYFNEYKGYDFEMFEKVDDDILEQIKIDIYQFNNEVACGPAIELKEVAD